MKRRGRYHIDMLPAASRALIALRGPIQDHLREAIRNLADDPIPPHCIAMTGKAAGHFRIRVEDYRVVYRVNDERVTVIVVRVGHRGTVYDGLESW